MGEKRKNALFFFGSDIDKMAGEGYTLCIKKIRRMSVFMNKNMKRAFTITELVIVIAVVAILAAVLIPTFSNLIEKANVSNDTVLVRNLNEALIIAETTEGKPQTMHDALTAVAEQGYTVEKLTPRSTGHILWEQTSNRFALVKDNEIVFGDDSTKAEIGYTYWKITSDLEEVSTGKYSYYLADEVDESALTAALSVSTGVDVGNNSNIAINYANNEASATAQNVIFRTNGGSLTVNGSKDTVSHYGSLVTADVQAVANNSYHEYGTVLGNIKVEQGRVVLESSSEVATVVVTTASESLTGTTLDKVVKIEDKSGSNTTVAATNETVAGSLTTVVTGTENVTTTVVSEEDLNMFAGGLGTEASPYLIETAKHLTNINKIGSANYLVTSDITVESSDLVMGAEITCVIKTLQGSVLDGGNHTIRVNAEDIAFVESFIRGSTIKNVDFQLKNSCVAFYGYIDILFENVDVYGTAQFDNNNGVYIVYACYNVTLNNCHSYVDITAGGANDNYNAVFVGFAWVRATQPLNLTFNDCTNEGTFVGGVSTMFIGNVPNAEGKVTLTVNNCENNGLIQYTCQDGKWEYNHFIGTQLTDKVTLIKDGTTFVGAEIVNSSVEVGVKGAFMYGPSDATLALKENGDGTFTIKPSAQQTVQYYEVTLSLYATWESGSMVVRLTERIDANGQNDLITTIMNLQFVDLQYLEGKEYTITDLSAEQSYGSMNKMVVVDGVSYYLMDVEGCTLNGLVRSASTITVSAYDTNGKLVASASL